MVVLLPLDPMAFSYIFSVRKEISCMLEDPLYKFSKIKKIFIVLEYFLKQGHICSHEISVDASQMEP